MAMVLEERDERLRLRGIGGPVTVQGQGALAGIERPLFRKPGVIVFPDIPAGVNVTARLDLPLDWVPSGGTLAEISVAERPVGSLAGGVLAAFRFEHGAPPDVTLPGGAIAHRTVKRYLVQSGNGVTTPVQGSPAFAAFSPVQEGSLAQKGKLERFFTMPGLVAGEKQEYLRLRWTGTVVAGATLVAGGGLTLWQDIVWTAAQNTGLVPGSILVTLPTGGPLRDMGDGRLVGPGGDGLVDYQTGAWILRTTAVQAGNILVDFEHSCPYHPIDAHLSWDSLANR